MKNKFIFLNSNNIEYFLSFINQHLSANLVDKFKMDNFPKMIDYLDINKKVSFILENEDETLGLFLGCIRNSEGYIPLILVNKTKRGLGFGRILLQKGLSLFGVNGCSKVYLEVFKENKTAVSLYLSEGFDIKKEVYSFRNENNSFYNPDKSDKMQINRDDGYLFHPVFKKFNKEKQIWIKRLRSLLKIIENDGELYYFSDDKNIVGYCIIKRKLNRLIVFDIKIDISFRELFPIFLTNIIKGEKIVVAYGFIRESPMCDLFFNNGFYIESTQYELERSI